MLNCFTQGLYLKSQHSNRGVLITLNGMKTKNYYKLLPEQKKSTRYYVVIIFCFALSIVLLLFDKGAPCPPFDESFQSIDCDSIYFYQYIDRNGQLDFAFNTTDTIEYIPEYLPYFINIEISTEGASFKYSGKQLKNISYNDDLIYVSLDHSFSGFSNIHFNCLRQKLMDINTLIAPIEIYEPDHSFADSIHTEALSLHNVCLEYEKFLYFTSIMGDMSSVPFDQEPFRFEFLQWPLSAYLDHKSVNMTQGISYMLSEYEQIAWKQLLFNINPLLNDIKKRLKNKVNSSHFIFRHDPDLVSIPILNKIKEKLSKKKPFQTSNIQKLEPIQCFDELVMTKTHSMSNVKNDETMKQALELDFSLTKKIFKEGAMKNDLILIPPKYIETFRFHMPHFEFVPFEPNKSFLELANLASQAHIMIGDHISSLIFSLFMSEKSTVIDITPTSFSCNRWIDNFPTSAKVISLFNDSTCSCQQFSCYLESNDLIDNTIDYNELQGIIRNNLNRR